MFSISIDFGSNETNRLSDKEGPEMLVLGRKENESIIIGDTIKVTIVGRCGASVRVGIQAPKEIPVVREELSSSERDSFAKVKDLSQTTHSLG